MIANQKKVWGLALESFVNICQCTVLRTYLPNGTTVGVAWPLRPGRPQGPQRPAALRLAGGPEPHCAGGILHANSRMLDSGMKKQILPVWERGVSLKFLNGFARDYDVRGLTTEEVCEKHIKPETILPSCSVWETIWTASSEDPNSTLIGTPTCMVSHAWLYQFMALMGIIRNYFLQNRKRQGQSVSGIFRLHDG